jgi:hypothetical protein
MAPNALADEKHRKSSTPPLTQTALKQYHGLVDQARQDGTDVALRRKKYLGSISVVSAMICLNFLS